MKSRVKKFFKSLLNILGLEIQKKSKTNFPVEISEFEEVVNKIISDSLTMVSRERLIATAIAASYVSKNKIEGDFVECGVWRGGNSILAASVFKRLNQQRVVHLFDTFSGMTKPTSKDFSLGQKEDAQVIYSELVTDETSQESDWCRASLDEVRENFSSFELPLSSVNFIQGDVLKTLRQPEKLPEKISILRLDTDWFESTKLELEVLYPRLVEGGVLIIDDYGHWGGAKEAVDEYFRNREKPLFNYIDYTGRMAVKTTLPKTDL